MLVIITNIINHYLFPTVVFANDARTAVDDDRVVDELDIARTRRTFQQGHQVVFQVVQGRARKEDDAAIADLQISVKLLFNSIRNCGMCVNI